MTWIVHLSLAIRMELVARPLSLFFFLPFALRERYQLRITVFGLCSSYKIMLQMSGFLLVQPIPLPLLQFRDIAHLERQIGIPAHYDVLIT